MYKAPPLATIESFDMLTRKDRLGDFLVRENIPAPRTFRIDESGGQFELFGEYSFPLSASPSEGDGGKEICLIPGAQELEDFYQDPERRRYGHYILQEYIRGYDIDCSVLAVAGEIAAYTIQVGVVARQRAYAAPGGVQFLHEPKLLDVVSRMIKSARFSGIAHVDARYDEESGEFKIIKVNARYWGSLTASLQAGVNFPYLATQLACGRGFSFPSYAAAKYIDLLTYTKRLLRWPHSRATDKFRISETDLRHFASDPIAEAVNVLRRRAP